MSRGGFGRDFWLLWIGQGISQLGSFVSVVALPLVALLALDASAFEVAMLTAVGYTGALVIGLPAGAWVDRWRRRPVMIVSDTLRALLLASVPIAAVMNQLTLPHLFVVALLMSIGSVFFDVAYNSYLPTVVPEDRLVDANSRLEATASAAAIGAPPLAGLLIRLFTAPAALVLDAVSFVVSAASLVAIRKREPRVPPQPQPSLRREIGEGLRLAFGDAALRASVLTTATLNLFAAGFDALGIVFLVREVGLSPSTIGLLLAAGGIGGVVGAAVVAPWLARRLGSARAMLLSLTVMTPFGLLIPLTSPGVTVLLYGLGELMVVIGVIVYRITTMTFNQVYAPPGLLGRLLATRRVVAQVSLAVGAVMGGALAVALGVRGALWVVLLGQMLAPLWLFASPIRRMREFAPADHGAGRTAAEVSDEDRQPT